MVHETKRKFIGEFISERDHEGNKCMRESRKNEEIKEYDSERKIQKRSGKSQESVLKRIKTLKVLSPKQKFKKKWSTFQQLYFHNIILQKYWSVILILVLSHRTLILIFDVLKTVLDEGRILIILINHIIHWFFVTDCAQWSIQIFRVSIVSIHYFLRFRNKCTLSWFLFNLYY